MTTNKQDYAKIKVVSIAQRLDMNDIEFKIIGQDPFSKGLKCTVTGDSFYHGQLSLTFWVAPSGVVRTLNGVKVIDSKGYVVRGLKADKVINSAK